LNIEPKHSEANIMYEEELPSILSATNLKQGILTGQVALVTGGGAGIGYQTARSLLWLGASVILAEVNRSAGKRAELSLAQEFSSSRVKFIKTDVGRQASVQNLARKSREAFDRVDILINNAAIAPLGKIVETPIRIWDDSYRVNLRGPVMLIQQFLPEMYDRKSGTIINVSSTGTSYMGAYETFKSAQVHLTETLDAELSGSDVLALTIAPGLVPTVTATMAIEQLAPKLGLSLENFYEMNQKAMLSIEEAGAGFAAAVVLANRFRGQEISARQALLAAGYQATENVLYKKSNFSEEERISALKLAESIYTTFHEQTTAWNERSLFERQWMLRDFRKHAGMPVDQWAEQLTQLVVNLRDRKMLSPIQLQDLSAYYVHLTELAKGYIKDPEKLDKDLTQINHWHLEVEQLIRLLESDEL
jgi:NAD(P)-dependent dehydrogenase (short-subunit alcohol dehydrogenase family)